MSPETVNGSSRIRRWMQTCGMLALGIVAGALFREPPAAGQETRDAPTRKAFLSGSERSVIVLDEILTVLKRMDGRLERMERIVAPKPNP